MNKNTLKILAGGFAIVLAAAMASAQTHTIWTNMAGGVWGDDANWDSGKPGANTTAYLTNTLNSYTVDFNATDINFAGANAVLVMTNSPGQTVTLNVNARMNYSHGGTSATRFELQLGGGSLINVNANALSVTVRQPVLGDIVVNNGGAVYWNLIDTTHPHTKTIQVNSGGSFHVPGNAHFRLGSGGSVTIETNAVFNMITTYVDIYLADANAAAGYSVITNKGSFYPTRRLLINYCSTGRTGEFYMVDGLLMMKPAAGYEQWIGISTADASGHAGVGRFIMTGGVVTNNYKLMIGASLHASSGTHRNTDGTLSLGGGLWLNNGEYVLVGGFQPETTSLSVTNTLNYGGLKGFLTQTGGVFRSLVDVYVANGPSQGMLSISGGSFAATNASNDATLHIGSKVGANMTLAGMGTLAMTGGTLLVDRLVATNGADFSKIQFSGGTIETKGTDVDNGSVLTVGNGTDAAVLNLLGGTHSFADGLTVPRTRSTPCWPTSPGRRSCRLRWRRILDGPCPPAIARRCSF